MIGIHKKLFSANQQPDTIKDINSSNNYKYKKINYFYNLTFL